MAPPHHLDQPTVGFSRVSLGLPAGTEPVDRVLERAGRNLMERRTFLRFYGLRDSPTLGPAEELEDLLVTAGRRALAGQGADVVLYGHSLLVQEFAADPGFAQRVCDRLGVPGAEFYGISHTNCVSVLRALDLAHRRQSRPEVRPGGRVLVIGGDQGSFDDAARVIPGVTVAGDAAVATLVRSADRDEPPRYRYLGSAALRDDRYHRCLRMTPEEVSDYPRACLTHTTSALRTAVRRAGLEVADLDWVMPDLSSALFWRNFCRMAGVPRERVCLDLLPTHGHNNGVDALLALEHADRTGRLRPGDRCALVALGHGAYFQVTVIEVGGE